MKERYTSCVCMIAISVTLLLPPGLSFISAFAAPPSENHLDIKQRSGNISKIGVVNVSALPAPVQPIDWNAKIMPAPDGSVNSTDNSNNQHPVKTNPHIVSAAPGASTSTVGSVAAAGTTESGIISTSPSFVGLDYLQTAHYPPDVQLAAGKAHLVELVNTIGAVMAKDGTQNTQFSLTSFFMVAQNTGVDIGDPFILYDSI